MRLSNTVTLLAALSISETALATAPVEIQKIFDPTAGIGLFSYSIAVDTTETQLFIGAPTEVNGQGEVFVYDRIPGNTFAGPQELTPPDLSCSQFGASVAISGNTAVVGAPGWPNGCLPNLIDIGKVFIYTLSNGAWIETAELEASDGANQDKFGASVAVDGSTIVVGAPQTEGQGAAYVFEKDNSGLWTQTQKLLPGVVANGNRFGQVVTISGDTLVAASAHVTSTSPGAIDIFSRSGHVWTRIAGFSGQDVGDGFGTSVSMNANTIAVGMPTATVNGHIQQGAVRIFRLLSGIWSNSQTITVSTGAASDMFGYSVALASGQLLAGAQLEDAGGQNNAGAAYYYADIGTSFSPLGRLTAAGTSTAGYKFGSSAALATGFSSQMPATPTYFIGAVGAAGNIGAVLIFH